MSAPIDFLTALARGLSEAHRLIVCGFPGDPAAASPKAWRPRPWKPGQRLGMNGNWNAYVTVSSFRPAADKSWRRKRDCFGAAHALMIDDVGTKVPLDKINLAPSAIVETSPANFQYWYLLTAPEPDGVKFDALIRAFIDGKLMGSDPGMSGLTRVGRLPGFPNLKPKYKGFVCRLQRLDPLRYSVSELIAGFGLKLEGRQVRRPVVVTEESLRRNRAFVGVYNFLQARGMLKRAEPDLGGWTEMTCPWVHEHTGGIDNGAAIRDPNPENGYYGAFRCHHGSHIDRHWGDLCEWVNDLAVEELEEINKRA